MSTAEIRIAALRREVDALTAAVDRQVDASAFAQLEARVARLEQRLGITG